MSQPVKTAPPAPRVWTIYRLPGGRYVVRGWDCGGDGPDPVGDTEPLYVGDDLFAARSAIPFEAHTIIHRQPDDDPRIVETWTYPCPS